MTWIAKLFKEKGLHFVGGDLQKVNFGLSYHKGMEPTVDYLDVNDLVLAVLEEYDKIVDESNRDYMLDDVEKVIKDRLSDMAMELVQACEKVKK